jgi:putative transposase
MKIETPSQPWQIINMDFITALPPAGRDNYNACLVIVDRFSRLTRFIATHENADAKTTAMLFWHHCWSRSGMPQVIISDRDPKFTFDFWRALSQRLGTRLAFSTSHHAQTDGLAERMNQTLEDLLRRFVAFGKPYRTADGSDHDWFDILPALEFAYNSTRHSTTGKTPFEIECGYVPLAP